MNRVYGLFLDHLASADIDLTSVDVRVQMLDADAEFDNTDEVLADLGAVTVGSSVSVGSITLDYGQVSAVAESVTVPAVSGDDVAAAVLYVHSGVSGTSYLIAWIDTQPDTTAVALDPTGADVTVWLADPLISL